MKTSKERKAHARSQIRYLWVSQYYTLEEVRHANGVSEFVWAAAYTGPRGPRGLTYDIGRNRFKRSCRAAGLNHVRIMRNAVKRAV